MPEAGGSSPLSSTPPSTAADRRRPRVPQPLRLVHGARRGRRAHHRHQARPPDRPAHGDRRAAVADRPSPSYRPPNDRPVPPLRDHRRRPRRPRLALLLPAPRLDEPTQTTTTSPPSRSAAPSSPSTTWRSSRRRRTCPPRPTPRAPSRATPSRSTSSEEHQVAEALDAARDAGATVLAEPVKRDWGGVSAYFADPEGNAWEIAWLPGATFDDRGALIWPF